MDRELRTPGGAVGRVQGEKFGYIRIVTGPTRKAVAEKVDELRRTGDRLVGWIEQADGGWTAVCDTGGAGR